jgi:hypothetical protein
MEHIRRKPSPGGAAELASPRAQRKNWNILRFEPKLTKSTKNALGSQFKAISLSRARRESQRLKPLAVEDGPSGADCRRVALATLAHLTARPSWS